MDSHTLSLRFPIPPNKAGYLSTIKDICKQTWQVQKPNMSDILTGIYNCPLQRKIWGILGLLSTQLVSSSFQTPSVVPLHHKVKEPDSSPGVPIVIYADRSNTLTNTAVFNRKLHNTLFNSDLWVSIWFSFRTCNPFIGLWVTLDINSMHTLRIFWDLTFLLSSHSLVMVVSGTILTPFPLCWTTYCRSMNIATISASIISVFIVWYFMFDVLLVFGLFVNCVHVVTFVFALHNSPGGFAISWVRIMSNSVFKFMSDPQQCSLPEMIRATVLNYM